MNLYQVLGGAVFVGVMFLLSDKSLAKAEGHPPYISRTRLSWGAFWIAFYVLFCLSIPAQAHDWYPRECCSAQLDCAPVPCESLASLPKGAVEYTPRSAPPKLFESSKVRPSQDSQCHVCLHGSEQSPICVFTQQGV